MNVSLLICLARWPLAAAEAAEGFFTRAGKWLIHFDYDKIRGADDLEFEFVGRPEGWWLFAVVVCLAGIVGLVFWLYRREGRTASPRKRYFLAVVRTLALLLALFMFLEPTLIVSRVRETLSPVIVLIDASDSMNIADMYSDVDAGPEQKQTEHETETYGPKQKPPNETEKVASPVARAVIDVTGMGHSDVRGQRLSRAKIVRAALGNETIDFLNRLAENNPVHVYAFATDPEQRLQIRLLSKSDEDTEEDDEEGEDGTSGRISPGDLELISVDPAARGRTHIGGAVSALLDAQAGKPVAGVVVITDGEDTADADGDKTVAEAGKAAARAGIPVYAVLVGLSESRAAKNIKVDKSLAANRTIFVDDPAEFTASVSSSGYELDLDAKAELYRKKVGSDKEELVDSKDVVIQAKTASQSVSFTRTHRRGEEGEYVYRIVVTLREEKPRQEENRKLDNVAIASGIRVIKATTNVLLISGSPNWEYRSLRNLLVQDKTVELSCWLQSASRAYPQMGNRLLKKLPRTREEIFHPRDGYHVIILIDIRLSDFDLEWFKLLKEFVEDKAGGLLYIAGEKYTYDLFKSSGITSPLIKMLPVDLDLEQALMERGGSVTRWARPYPLKPTEDGLSSPLFRFHTERARIKQMWAAIPGAYWTFPVRRATQAGTVLMRTLDGRRVRTIDGRKEYMPVFTKSFFGAGRVAFMAFDGSWRWRRLGARVYDTFWTQCVRSLVEGRLMGGKRSATVETNGDKFSLGDPVKITAKVFDAKGKPARIPGGVKVKVTLAAPEVQEGEEATDTEKAEQVVALEPVARADGIFIHRYYPKYNGYYKLALVGAEAGAASTTNFEVSSQKEFKNPEANPVRLRDLTDANEAGYFYKDFTLQRPVKDRMDFASIPDRIESKKETMVERGDELSLWANPLALGLMTLLLGIEWTLRKRANMA